MTTTTTETVPPPAAPHAGRRTWPGLALLTLPTLLVGLDMNVLFPALPVGAVHGLPGRPGADLLRAAHDAFTGGPHVAGVAGAVVFAGLAVLFSRVHR